MDNKEEILARYVTYRNAASRGATLSALLSAGKISEEKLSYDNIMDIRTNQFKESWLSRYSLADIPWLKNQFKK